MNIIALLLALIMVESSGNDLAKGDIDSFYGPAYGCMQITPAVVSEVNHEYGDNYTHEDMFNRDISIDVFIKYTNIYCGEDASFKERCIRWNPGDKDYWNKISVELDKMNVAY